MLYRGLVSGYSSSIFPRSTGIETRVHNRYIFTAKWLLKITRGESVCARTHSFICKVGARGAAAERLTACNASSSHFYSFCPQLALGQWHETEERVQVIRSVPKYLHSTKSSLPLSSGTSWSTFYFMRCTILYQNRDIKPSMN
jgi:hypothetical protein